MDLESNRFIFGAHRVIYALQHETDEVKEAVTAAVAALQFAWEGPHVRRARGRAAAIEAEYGNTVFIAKLPHGYHLSFVLGKDTPPLKGHEIVCGPMVKVPPNNPAP